MICKDMDVATQVSRSTNFDSITLDGDRVDTRGPITGGYHDERHSKMDAMKATWPLPSARCCEPFLVYQLNSS
jgi:structural maintenance of chromosome 3 (chondroitin sulfate proteoglycan 6)